MGSKISVDDLLCTASSQQDKIFLIQVIGQQDIKRLVKTVRAMLVQDLNHNRRNK